MSNWKTYSIGELITDIGDGGTPSRNNPDNFGGGIPWVVIDDIQHEIWETRETLSDKGFLHSSSKLWNKDTIILSTGATIGEVGIAKIPLATKQGISGLVCGSLILPEFFYYKLQSLKPYLNSIAQGSTIKEVRPPTIKQIKIEIPCTKEQSKIAEVLSTIDSAIAQTEALIAKHQRIRTGLMQDLLTRGIDEHGQLRDLSTHKFKSTPLGMIPIEWEVTTLGTFLERNRGFVQTGPFGSQLHAEEYVPSGIPMIMPRDITEGQILTDDIDHITEEKANTLLRHRVKPNDVIFARRGDLSRAAAISEREAGWLCGTGCFLLRAPKGKLDATWLAMTYRFPSIQRQVMANAIGSTMPNLNGPVMKNLIFAFPTFDEQVAIVERLSAQSKLISQNAEQVKKLNTVKAGLMQDLLSGEVSVTPLLEN